MCVRCTWFTSSRWNLQRVHMRGTYEICASCSIRVCVQVYHVACFNCVMCKKKLDANLTEKDGDIYCKGSC
jgi:hypothetical protein